MNYENEEKLRELCCMGDLELVKGFISKHNPDLNSKNKINGWTALHWAAKRNHSNVVKYLIEMGADAANQNNEGKVAAQYATSSDIKRLLGLESSNEESETIEPQSKPKFIPNFLKHPEFHYANSQFSSYYQSNDKKEENQTEMATEAPYPLFDQTKRASYSIDDTKSSTVNSLKPSKQDIITIRVRTSLNEDFIEVDVDKANTTFEQFKKLCLSELSDCGESYVDSKMLSMDKIRKIRKLPNILMRNTSDIRRLREDQEIEILFS